MAVITISAIGIGPELISGIPQLVSLSTNVPSTIFFTLNGSAPTLLSNVYVDVIPMPTVGTVRLRALAISGVDIGSLDITFSTNTTGLTFPRRSEATISAGVVVDAYDHPNEFFDGYGSDEFGNINVPIRFSDINVPKFDIKLSRSGVGGEGLGTMLSVGFSSVVKTSISHDATTPNGNNIFFNPRSLFIAIDGRDGYRDQIHDGYKIINRPHAGTTDPVKYLQGRMYFQPQPYITGGFVRTFYNGKTGTAVSYYFDHNETRWIRSIQSYDTQKVPRSFGLRPQTGGPLIFKWVYNKRSMI